MSGINSTPSGERVHIGFFGMRNAGKSSLVNAVTNQELAVVSDTKGTTTDPVYKAMELLPIGPVMIIDTPGYDDEGALGELRIKKTLGILNKTDAAVLVVDAAVGKTDGDNELISLFNKKNIPYLIVYNKSDLKGCDTKDGIAVSTKTKSGIDELMSAMASAFKDGGNDRRLIADLVSPMQLVVLVVPIDSSAPKGRLILPQQQTIRDLLEAGAVSVVVRETELKSTLDVLGKNVSLVVTDSQAFKKVNAETPSDIPLTSFSILMARYKGFLDIAVKGAAAIDKLNNGDTVLISEGCTHHRQCEDIGTVKLPKWLREHTGKDLNFETSSGREFPEDLSKYSLIIHCGGCMLNEREMRFRMQTAADNGIPITNYGTAIAYMQGILKRSIAIFPDLADQI